MSVDSDDFNKEYESMFRGELLKKEYLILYKIGAGTFSTVWLALDIKKNKYYAIKIQNEDEYDSGVEEAKILVRIQKQPCKYLNNIVDQFEYESDVGLHYCLVFELMAGCVFDIIHIGKYSDGLPLPIVKKIVQQVLIAMDILNNKYNLLHTDIKPENILIKGINHKIREIIETVQKSKELAKAISKKIKNEIELHKIINSLSFNDIESKYNKKRKDKITEYIKEENITNIEIKLADFGNCRSVDYTEFDIQTRYYRAPEITLGYRYNKNCDMWSVGCLIFELLTGETLFNPDKKKRFGRDSFHILEMVNMLGKFPDDLLEQAKFKNVFFKNNGLLRGVHKLDYNPLYKVLTEYFSDREDFNPEQLFLTIDFMHKLLDYYPERRPTAKIALEHKWFKV